MLLIKFLGDCLIILPKKHKSTCKINRINGVNDEYQNCDLKFASWTHNGFQLDLKNNYADSSSFKVNEKWELLGKLSSMNTVVEYYGASAKIS